MGKIAVVILNWNGLPMMRKYLPSVVNFSMDEAEVWVADNDSTDGSLAWLERECPAVRTLKLDTNYGFAEGYNRALRQIEAEYYVLINSDVAVTPGWLTPLLGFMESHPEVAACQPKLLSERDHSSFEYAGACGGFMDRYGYPFCRGRVFDTVEKDHGQYDMPAEVFWTTGACMMIRSRDYWALATGQSPEDFPQFPQQSYHALQEPARWRIAPCDACALVAGLYRRLPDPLAAWQRGRFQGHLSCP